MPDEQAHREEGEHVVDGAGAVEDEAMVALAEPEEETRESEEECEGDGEQRVDLLARVEAALRRPAAREPATVVAIDRRGPPRGERP